MNTNAHSCILMYTAIINVHLCVFMYTDVYPHVNTSMSLHSFVAMYGSFMYTMYIGILQHQALETLVLSHATYGRCASV